MIKSNDNNSKIKFGVIKSPYDWYALLIGLALLTIPLAIKGIETSPQPASVQMFGTEALYSLYVEIKYHLLIAFSVIMAVIMAIFYRRLNFQKDKAIKIALLATAVYTVFTFLSAVFAEYRAVAFLGETEQLEGFFTLLSYVVLFVYTKFVYTKTDNYCFIVLPMMVIVAVNAAIGVYELTGNNFLNIDMIKMMVIPTSLWDNLDNITLSVANGSGTFANPNYLSAFSAVAIPFFLTLAVTANNIKAKLAYGIWTVLSVFLLIFSYSSSGVIGVAFMAVMMLIVFRHKLVKYWKVSLGIVLAGVIVIVSANFATNNGVVNAISPIIDSASSLLFEEAEPMSAKSGINNVIVKQSEILLDTAEGALTISNDGLNFVFTDENNIKHTPIISEDNIYTFEAESLKGFSLAFNPINDQTGASTIIRFRYNGNLISYFGYDGNFFYRSPYTLAKTSPDYPEVWLFEGKENIGSSRGYVWGRSLPMITDSIILGVGPDNFAYEFPQHDILGKAAINNLGIIYTKPHNLYLQVLINNGGVAFIAFMAVLAIYFLNSLKLYSNKQFDIKEAGMGIAIFLSISSYLASALFNDSLVQISPVFWILLGAGFAVNYKAKLKLSKLESVDADRK